MAVTEEEVRWCYRSILGREPESAEIVQQKAAAERDFRTLVLGFIASGEYRLKVTRPALVPLDRAEIDVQTSASPVELTLLEDRIRETWTQLGLDRPHDSVLSGEDYLPENIDEESVARFFASGVEELVTIEAILSRAGFVAHAAKTCVEFGCGLGRVTFALKTVHGYDISANHLELARRHAAEVGMSNVEFHLCPVGALGETLAPCDFFYSRLVFQHNPPPLIRALIRAALASLRPGGIAIFQVPTYGIDYSFSTKGYLAGPRRRDIEMHCIPQRDVFAEIAAARCTLLEVDEDTAIGQHGEWISNTFVVQRPEAA